MRKNIIKNKHLNDPELTIERNDFIRQHRFINLIYQEWYTAIQTELENCHGKILEIGAGAGFLEDFIQGLIKSDIFYLPFINAVIDGKNMPFGNGSLSAIVATDVLHHIPDARKFLAETNRVLNPSGKIVLIEPWATKWSGFIYRNLHHEAFDPDAVEWVFSSDGPLSSSNQALPWIIFFRDRQIFAREFPYLTIKKIKTFMPFRYILSGGFSTPALMPSWTFNLWKSFERLFNPVMDSCGMFALIVLQKIK
jgi:SAM-dependent methyltransferase